LLISVWLHWDYSLLAFLRWRRLLAQASFVKRVVGSWVHSSPSSGNLKCVLHQASLLLRKSPAVRTIDFEDLGQERRIGNRIVKNSKPGGVVADYGKTAEQELSKTEDSNMDSDRVPDSDASIPHASATLVGSRKNTDDPRGHSVGKNQS
jgi:hypothetical protein